MNRLTEEMVSWGAWAANPRAAWPTTTAPSAA